MTKKPQMVRWWMLRKTLTLTEKPVKWRGWTKRMLENPITKCEKQRLGFHGESLRAKNQEIYDDGRLGGEGVWIYIVKHFSAES